MNNDIVFVNLQRSYDNLSAFSVKDNTLFFHFNGNIYQLPLNSVNLNLLDPSIFLLKPKDIYRVIYLLELLPKDNLTPSDEEFVVQYTEKYLRLEQERVEHTDNEGYSIDEKTVFGLSIPINAAYNPQFVLKKAAKIIDELLCKKAEEIESGNFKGHKLVRFNPSTPKEIDFDEDGLQKTGFTTFIIIASTVILTGIYIAYYILGK